MSDTSPDHDDLIRRARQGLSPRSGDAARVRAAVGVALGAPATWGRRRLVVLARRRPDSVGGWPGSLLLQHSEQPWRRAATPWVVYPTRLDAALDDHGRALIGTLLIGTDRVSVRFTRE